MARKTLDAWIHEILTDNDYGGKCTRIVLSHMVGTGRTEIHTLKLSPTGSVEPKALATMFIGKADAYCQDMRGENRFILDAYWQSTEAQAFQPFTRRGQVDNSSGLTHPATEEGRLMQKMEWEANLIGQVYRRQERQDQREDRAAERMEAEREGFYRDRVRLMEENFKFFGLLKEIMVMQNLDAHKQAMDRLAYQRATQREEKLMNAIPMMANMVTGKEIFPQSTIDTTIIEALAKKLTPEMVGMLGMLGLTDEEQGIIMHRLNQAREKADKEEQHRAQLPTSSMSGEEELSLGAKGDTH